MYYSAYKFRHLARVVVEADTPVKISSGIKNFITDAPVLMDINGLPYIPGTSLAGIFRRLFDETTANSIFGVQDEEAFGSRIIISDALLCDEHCVPVEGYLPSNSRSGFLKEYEALPIRQHVKIDAKGVSAKACKFDEQIVFKGSRFCFEITLLAEENGDRTILTHIIDAIAQEDVRVGGGTRKGFGQITLHNAYIKTLDLTNEKDLGLFINKSSSIKQDSAISKAAFWQVTDLYSPDPNILDSKEWSEYKLTLRAKDLFLFSTGFPSEDGSSNFTPVTEKVITGWGSGTGAFEKRTLIPATSVKGALAHRIAFYYNKQKGIGYQLDDNGKWRLITASDNYINQENPAVVLLFGSANINGGKASRGNVIIKDFYFTKGVTKKHYLNHVVIDPLSGGSNGVGLFTECTNYTEEIFVLTIKVKTSALEKDNDVRTAFESALDDLKSGMLPLGGGVNRGNGIFSESK